MKLKLFLGLMIISMALSCGKTDKKNNSDTTQEAISEKTHWGKNWVWMYVNRGDTSVGWNEKLMMIKDAGIDGILLLLRDHESEEFVQVSKMGKALGLEVHVWLPMLNPHGADSIEKAHPDWYVVNRDGISCLEKPAYISSYKWLCPSRKEVRDHLVMAAGNLAKKEYLDGVHLDYIRLPDVILPLGIQPRYDLVQDKEYPEFDYCYCDVCRSSFKKIDGRDPLEMDHPELDSAWRQYRYNIITNLVGEFYDEVHKHGKELTAAVFPTPDLAKKMVRQDWTNWKIDRLMPMIYHQYYNKPLSWVESATREGTDELVNVPLYSGLFINEISPEEMKDAVEFSKNGNSSGICLFNANAMTDEHWKAMKEALIQAN